MIHRVALFLLMLVLTGCGSPAPQITTAHDPAIDFSQYKTYAWHPQGMSAAGIPTQRAQLAQMIIKQVVEQELTLSGFKPATYNTPDFFITSTIGAVNLSKVRQWGTAEGGFTQTPTQVPVDQVEIREGAVVIDLIDNQTSRLLWRGMAHGVVSPGENMKPQIEAAVRAIMSKFPPR